MKKEFTLNFWHALLLLISINVIYILIGLPFVIIFKDSFKTDPFQIATAYLYAIIFIPFIFWYAKKTNIDFRNSLLIPNTSTIAKMIAIVVLMNIVLAPLVNPVNFFESLINSKLRIIGGTTRLLNPWSDIRMVLFWPIIEELFFRGLILKNFLRRYSPIYAILLSSLLFGLHHYSWFIGQQAKSLDNALFYVACGVLYGIIYYKTNSLISVIIAHMTWNILTFLRYEYIEIEIWEMFLHASVYATAFVLLSLQLKKGLKPIPINDRSPYSDK